MPEKMVFGNFYGFEEFFSAIFCGFCLLLLRLNKGFPAFSSLFLGISLF